MDTRGKTILVIGATGQQGSAATRHLMDDGWKVRAFIHHPDTPAVRSLRERGVEIFPGDLMDKDSLYRAAEGAYGIYSMQTPRDAGFDGEEIEGKNAAEVAKAADVQHFVYSSMAGAEADDAQGYALPKHHIEEHIAELQLPATIWRPSLFMENYMRHRDEILEGHLKSPAWQDSLSDLIAVDDIGRFVALAFRQPDKFIGQTMTITGDVLTTEEIAKTFSRMLGIEVQYEHIEQPNMPTPPHGTDEQRSQYQQQIEASRKLLPDLASLATWIEATGWKARVRH